MQNRSIFPYRRHGPKKRIKHGSNRRQRGPQKGLPNSARDLLPLLQPATKALAQVLAGRAGASGQLGHARTMLAQAERLIAERAHNRLTPAEREEFFEQLARLKLTLADADAEAEVQAVEQHAPRPPAAPVAHERLKEMALALSVRERPSEPASPMEPGAVAQPGPEAEPLRGGQTHEGATDEDSRPADRAREGDTEEGSRTVAPARGRDRLVLPRASADQAVQALAIGGLARRRHRATSWAAAASAAESAGRVPSEPGTRAGESTSPPRTPLTEPDRGDGSESHGGNGATAEPEAEQRGKSPRRRKSKNQGLPEGWVIDEEGFVVPGAG